MQVDSEIRVPEGAHDLEIRGAPEGTTLLAGPGFRGRAILSLKGGRSIRIRRLGFDGNRAALAAPAGLPPSSVAFVRFTTANALLAEEVAALAVEQCAFRNVAGFAILVAASKDVRIENVTVENSGSRNQKDRNNTTGGILLEEGTAGFEVRGSTFRNVEGNGVWTHSNYGSSRNGPGLIVENRFDTIGRDAIQVGHATEVKVLANRGVRIGYPVEVVDVEGGATPVGIDTSGNVDRSAYNDNRFEELNGKCIDLDGFHDGEVRRNTCLNRGRAEDYPSGHFAMVVNNWNPDMKSENIAIVDNLVDGSKFGGIFLLGSRHKVLGNRLLNLNLAGCNESRARFGCVAIQGEPDVLQSGIYLGRIAAEWAQKRGDASRDLVIENNLITGHRMKTRCIMAAPGVSLEESVVRGNTCEDTARKP